MRRRRKIPDGESCPCAWLLVLWFSLPSVAQAATLTLYACTSVHAETPRVLLQPQTFSSEQKITSGMRTTCQSSERYSKSKQLIANVTGIMKIISTGFISNTSQTLVQNVTQRTILAIFCIDNLMLYCRLIRSESLFSHHYFQDVLRQIWCFIQ